MYDATLFYKKKAKDNVNLEKWGLTEKAYALCTVHRAENTDDRHRLQSVKKALNIINKTLPIILPLHPRTKKIIKESTFSDLLSSLIVVDPVSYIETQRLEMWAKLIFTDSGGMQKEAYFHKVPCITLRDETEWMETVNSGWNNLVGTEEGKIIQCYENIVMPSTAQKLYGDGASSSLIVNFLLK